MRNFSKLTALIILLIALAVVLFGAQNELKKNPNLTMFYQWTKEDPLFTSPDFDAKKFKDTIGALEAEEKAFISYLGTGEPIFPMPFLKQIAEVDRLHRQFLASPSETFAQQLIQSYYQLAEQYKKGQQTVLQNIRANLPSDLQLVGTNTITSSKVMLADLEKLGSNHQALMTEIKIRERCLYTGEGCQKPSSTFLKPQLKKNQNSFKDSDFLKRNILLPLLDQNIPLFGPYIVATTCFGWGNDFTPQMQPFYVFQTKNYQDLLQSKQSLPVQVVKLATTNYYQKLIKEAEQDQFLQELGLTWVSQLETNVYLCTDFTYQSRLATLDSFYRQFYKMPLYQDLLSYKNLPDEVSDHLKAGEDLEKTFFTSKYPAEADAENLAKYYAYTYHQLEEWGKKYSSQRWFKEAVKIQDEFLTRYLIYERKLSNIYLVFGRALDNFSTLRVKYLVYSLKDKMYPYGLRHMYGTAFLPFSASFYRLPQPLEYLEKKELTGATVGEEGFFMNYQQARTKFSDDEIKSWYVDQYELLKKILKQFNSKR